MPSLIHDSHDAIPVKSKKAWVGTTDNNMPFNT